MVVFLISGCGLLRHLDGSSERDIEAFKALGAQEEEGYRAAGGTARTSAPARTAADVEVEGLKTRIMEMEAEQHRLNQKLAESRRAMAEGQASVEAGELDALKAELATTRQQVSALEAAMKSPEKPPAAALPTLRIKVLSGDGELASAREMKKTLESLGFAVERIDLAPRPDFKSDVIFYNKGFESVARNMAGRAGGVRVKPMTWRSIFDIIVVHNKS
jgi:hypothetical protein